MAGWMDQFSDQGGTATMPVSDLGGYGFMGALAQNAGQGQEGKPTYDWNAHQGGDFEGLSFTSSGTAPGMPGVMKNPQTFGRIAEMIMGGSRGAQGALRQMYDELYRTRAEGLTQGMGAYGESLDASTQSQGLSPLLAEQMMRQKTAETTAAKGSALGESRAGYYGDMADLIKGTGTELAGLKMSELQMILQAYLASKARSSAKKGAMMGLAGTALGTGAALAL